MELRPGYRQTQIGMIPEDWEVKPLGEFVALQRGHDLTESQRCQGNVPVMGSAGLNGFHDTALVHGPGVVLGRSGASFGQAHYCACDFWPHNTVLYVTDFFGNVPMFVFHFLKSFDFSHHNSGGAQQSLNRNLIASIPVAIPRPREQEAIAKVLSDTDALIESLDQLIAKKTLLKQGTMQGLLTGRNRLPGFVGVWQTKRLADVADTNCDTLSGDTHRDYVFKYISLEDVDNGVLMGYTEQTFWSAPSRARRRLRSGDVLVATVRPNLKSHLLFNNDSRDWICSTGFAVVRCRPMMASPDYVFYQFFGEAIGTQIDAHLTGSNYPAISSGDVESLGILVPPYEEQQAIATVLSDMDTEIANLKAKVAKTRLLKQGMMQEILTGRIRVSRGLS